MHRPQTLLDLPAVRALIARGESQAAARLTHLMSPLELAKLLQFLQPGELPPFEAALGAERLADVLEALGPRDAAELLLRGGQAMAADVLEEMGPDAAAGLLEEIEPDRAADVVEAMALGEAADVLEEMDPGEAADVLEEMDRETAADVLEAMEPDEAIAVVDELRHGGVENIVGAMGAAEAYRVVLAREARLAKERGTLRRFLSLLGPGLVTGASDDDPSGIGTYAVAGASYGYATLWTALLTFPLMTAIQYVCAKIGIVTGRGLAEVLRRHYPRWVLLSAVSCLLVANTINAGADIGAIAAAVNLLLPMPILVMIVPIAVLILALQVLGSYRLIARTFKWLTLALFAYVGAALFARPDWGSVLRGTFVPTLSLDRAFLATLVAILGTTVSPYLFFWQTSHEIEEQSSASKRWLWYRLSASRRELRYAGMDVGTGMFLSNLVMYFIILATGATLFARGHTDINSAAEAAAALRPISGSASSALLALGLIGAGLLAVPILTGSAAYAVAEVFRWRAGLDEPPQRAPRFYAVIVAGTLIGMLINFLGINPIDALFWTAVINGLLAPPLLVLIMVSANNPAIMADETNGPITNLLGWGTALLMTLAAVGFLITA